MFKNKSNILFFMLGAIFITNALLAEFIGVKIFAFEDTLGFSDFKWSLLGETVSLDLTAGVLLWPVVFILTDVINEYFGKQGVRFLSFTAVGLIIYAFFMIGFSINLAPASFWLEQGQSSGVSNMQDAYGSVFGQSNWIIVGSLVAFLVGQLLDVFVFQFINKRTNQKMIWLRATGSTLVSQFVDSFIVLYIAFVIGPAKWSMSLFLAVGTVNYMYKFAVAILLTPMIYAAHAIIDRFLGKERAEAMKLKAMN
jgi:uncharacterized integral membrane protein (TIGR00697 family)